MGLVLGMVPGLVAANDAMAVRTAALVPARHALLLHRGDVAVAMPDQSVVYSVDTLGASRVLAGNGHSGFSGDEGLAAEAMLNQPSALAVDAQGNLYIADTGNHRIRRVDVATRIIVTVAGDGEPGFEGDGGDATVARLDSPGGVAVDAGGNLYIADTGNNRVRRVDAFSGQIVTVAGDGQTGHASQGDLATNAPISAPTGVAFDDVFGRLIVSDTGNHRVLSIGADGMLGVIAGTGQPGFGGDLGRATEARLRFPSGVAVDRRGNVVIADAGNHRVRRISTSGRIATLSETLEVPVQAGTAASPANGRRRITLLSQQQREEWSVGSRRVIRWTHNLAKTTTFLIELSRDGGITWETIGTRVAPGSTVSAAWVVRGPATLDGLLRVRPRGASLVAGVSASFGIWDAD